jgi:hypothetical protein
MIIPVVITPAATRTVGKAVELCETSSNTRACALSVAGVVVGHVAENGHTNNVAEGLVPELDTNLGDNQHTHD